jgi:molybdopterin-guanine dinucleotide biosynthesis protein B
MRVFVVSGYSETGKTSLVEGLVSSLVKNGYSVATIKSSKHEEGPDKGTDTWRHLQAGSSMTLFHRASNDSVKLKDRIDAVDLAKLADYDFVIIEGMKSVDIPRFWCVGDNDVNLDDIPANTQAIVTWSERPDLISEIPVIAVNRVEQLVEIVNKKAVDASELE